MGPSSCNIKKFLYFLKRKLLLYFQKNPGLFSPSSKNKNNPPRENVLYFTKWKSRKNFKENFQSPKNQNLSYFSKKCYE